MSIQYREFYKIFFPDLKQMSSIETADARTGGDAARNRQLPAESRVSAATMYQRGWPDLPPSREALGWGEARPDHLSEIGRRASGIVQRAS